MLRSIKDIVGYAIKAKDGDIGKVDDFYFDDERWTIRYMITDIGGWMQGKSVLISPVAFAGEENWDKREFSVKLTKDKVKNCPDIDIHKPVFRQKEEELNSYYRWPVYWQQTTGFTGVPVPMAITGPRNKTASSGSKGMGDAHLRSFKEVEHYNIRAKDGEIGYVEDFIVDDKHWCISYMVVDTNKWMPGGKVIIALNWITDINWDTSEVVVDLSREEIKSCPLYDTSNGVNREYEGKIYDYYGRPKYW